MSTETPPEWVSDLRRSAMMGVRHQDPVVPAHVVSATGAASPAERLLDGMSAFNMGLEWEGMQESVGPPTPCPEPDRPMIGPDLQETLHVVLQTNRFEYGGPSFFAEYCLELIAEHGYTIPLTMLNDMSERHTFLHVTSKLFGTRGWWLGEHAALANFDPIGGPWARKTCRAVRAIVSGGDPATEFEALTIPQRGWSLVHLRGVDVGLGRRCTDIALAMTPPSGRWPIYDKFEYFHNPDEQDLETFNRAVHSAFTIPHYFGDQWLLRLAPEAFQSWLREHIGDMITLPPQATAPFEIKPTSRKDFTFLPRTDYHAAPAELSEDWTCKLLGAMPPDALEEFTGLNAQELLSAMHAHGTEAWNAVKAAAVTFQHTPWVDVIAELDSTAGRVVGSVYSKDPENLLRLCSVLEPQARRHAIALISPDVVQQAGPELVAQLFREASKVEITHDDHTHFLWHASDEQVAAARQWLADNPGQNLLREYTEQSLDDRETLIHIREALGEHH